MKTTRLALLLAALAASTYGSDAKVTLDSNNGSSAFTVRDSTSNELARVSSDGKVGIGTTTPASKLQVYGTETGANWAGKGVFGGVSNAVVLGQYNNKAYLGAHNADLNAWTDLVINPGGGKVGIGTTTPTDLLQVGNLMFGGNAGREIYSTSGYDINYKATGSAAHHFYTSGTEKLTIDGTGRVGIGTASPAEKLDISGNIRIPNNSSFVGASGSGDSFAYNNGTFNGTLPRYSLSWVNLGSTAEGVMSAVGGIKLLIGAANTGAYVDGTGVHNYSDVRLKKNIAPMSNMLEKVLQMQGATFNLIVNDQAAFGFIAQDLEKVFPLAVNTGTDSYKSVNYAAMTSVLVEAVKELKSEKDAEIDALKAEKDAEIAALKADNDTLKAQNAAITTQNADILKRLDALEAK
jgi:hypothetical protein